jgi:hypothetical protein
MKQILEIPTLDDEDGYIPTGEEMVRRAEIQSTDPRKMDKGWPSKKLSSERRTRGGEGLCARRYLYLIGQ